MGLSFLFCYRCTAETNKWHSTLQFVSRQSDRLIHILQLLGDIAVSVELLQVIWHYQGIWE